MNKEGEIMAKIENTQSNKFLLTINNPNDKGVTHDEIKKRLIRNFTTFSYCAMVDEKGSTDHTHIFVYFNSRVRWGKIKKSFPEAHIDIVKGRVSDNINYLKKTGKWALTEKSETTIDGTFEEFGKKPSDSKGKRSDMTDLYAMISEGMTNAEILAQNQDYILQVDKIDKVRTIILTEKYKETVRLDLEVVYISGATGTGKTRGVLEMNGYANVYRVTDYLHPFDGYNCQPVIAFDEFRSSLRIKEMLLFCDIYPIELPSRYTNKFACYNKVYIISNWSLEKQYCEVQREDRESWEAFLRRIHKVITYDNTGKKTVYPSVQAYLERDTDFRTLTVEEQKKLPFMEQEN